MKATFACPEQYVKGGLARVFMANDLQSISGDNKEHVITAVNLMQTFSKLGMEQGVANTSGFARIKGMMDTNLVL